MFMCTVISLQQASKLKLATALFDPSVLILTDHIGVSGDLKVKLLGHA